MKTNTLILSLVFCLIPARPILAQTQEPLPDERVMVEKEANPASSTVSESLKKKVLQTYGRLPLTFEANHGQTDASVDFLARGDGYNLFLTSTEVVLVLHKSQIAEPGHTAEAASTSVAPEDTELTELTAVRMKLIGANPATELSALEELASKSNYFIGNDPKKWHTNVPTYSKVARREVYPGIDLVFYGNQRELEYDFVVAADADPKVIRMAFEGTEQLGIDASGDLILNVPGGEIRLRKPVAYQERNGLREPVVVSYALKGTNEVAFAVSAYDVDRPLIIDPVLSYSTFLGGRGGADGINAAVTADSDGFIYVTGATSASTAFPISLGAFQRFRKGNNDTFVTKLDPSVPGFAGLVYSTFLGGSRQNESAFGIAVDNNGNASVTGRTLSDDFPTTPSAFQRGPSIVGFHAYVTVLNSSGSGLVYSTYLRGSTSDSGNAIAVDDSGNVYVTGTTSSSNFPNKNAVQPVFGGGTDAFVAKLDPTAFGADSLVYSTFLGDGGDDSGNGIAVDSSGAVYVSGDTASANFSLAGGTCQMIGSGGGDGDAFVTKLDAAGSVLTYCTFLGGVELDMATGIAVDNGGAAYIAGLTNSADFPIEGTFGTVFGGKGRFGIGDAFVAKLDADGSALNYSLFLGGSDRDFATGVAVDGSGAAYVVGTTRSDNFPVKDPLPGQGSLNRFNDAFVAKLDPTGSGLVYSTYLGGSQGGGSTFGNAISVDSSGAAYVVGETFADDFPTTDDAFQPIFRPASFGRSSSEAFVSKITSAPAAGSVTIDPGHGRQCNRADRRRTGTEGPTFSDTEDDLVLDIGLRLATTLRAAGHEVRMTRETECLIRPEDPDTDLVERALIANRRNTDIFVSIHLNADGPTAHGTEVWYFPEVEQGPLPPRAERSMSLAELTLNRQVALGLRNRGLKLAGFDPPWDNWSAPAVLRLTTMPAVLTEVAFLTNAQLAPDQTITDEELLHDADFRGQVEQAIAAAIAEFFEQ